jgi:hypothetical protein
VKYINILGGVLSKMNEANNKLVWRNECRLVFWEEDEDHLIGEMGLCYDDSEVQVRISSYDITGKHEVLSKLEGVPVRITIEVIPGGNE